jgi:septal ring factor EnvC (AmiA/AmiB activator)
MNNNDLLNEASNSGEQKHQAKYSYESLCSYLSESFSISSGDFKSSDESVNVEKVSCKTKELQDLINSRLTAFLYMSKRLCEQDEVNHEVRNFRKSLDRTLSYCFESQEKGSEVYVKNVVDQIVQLQKEYLELQVMLGNTRDEIRHNEEEIEELKVQQGSIESNISRIIEETQEKNYTTCQCSVI